MSNEYKWRTSGSVYLKAYTVYWGTWKNREEINIAIIVPCNFFRFNFFQARAHVKTSGRYTHVSYLGSRTVKDN